MVRRLAVAGVVIFALGAGFAGGWIVHQPSPPPQTESSVIPPLRGQIVPDVLHGTVRHAIFVLGSLGLRGVPVSGAIAVHMSDIVRGQNPDPGTTVPVGTTVDLFP